MALTEEATRTIEIFCTYIDAYAKTALTLARKGKLGLYDRHLIICALLLTQRTDLLESFYKLDQEMVNKPIPNLDAADGQVTMLGLASQWGNLKTVEWLLSKNAHPNPEFAGTGEAPLAMAVKLKSDISETKAAECFEVIKLLVGAGAKIDDEVIQAQTDSSHHYRLKLTPEAAEQIQRKVLNKVSLSRGTHYDIDEEKSYTPRIAEFLGQKLGKELNPVLRISGEGVPDLAEHVMQEHMVKVCRKSEVSDRDKDGVINFRLVKIIMGEESGKEEAHSWRINKKPASLLQRAANNVMARGMLAPDIIPGKAGDEIREFYMSQLSRLAGHEYSWEQKVKKSREAESRAAAPAFG